MASDEKSSMPEAVPLKELSSADDNVDERDHGGDEVESISPDKTPKTKTDRRGLLMKAGWGLGYRAPPDGGYGWAIVFVSGLLQMGTLGALYTGGIFYTELLDVFQAGESLTAVIGSVSIGLCLMTGPFTALFTYRFGFRSVVMAGALLTAFGYFISGFATNIYVLIVTNGIMAGLGGGLVFVPASVIVGYYFTTKRPIAVGLSCTGSSLGSLILAPVIANLIEILGWRGAYMIMGGVTLNMCVAAALIRPVDDVSEDAETKLEGEPKGEEKENKLFDFSLLIDPTQLLIMSASILCVFAVSGFLVLLPEYAMHNGVSRNNTSLLLSMFGVSCIIGQVAIGFVPTSVDRLQIMIFTALGHAIGILLTAITASFGALIAGAMIFGFSNGAGYAVFVVVLAQIHGTDKLNSAFGLMMLADGIGGAVGPPIGGALFELSKRFNVTFFVAGSFPIITSLIYAGLCLHQRRKKRAEAKLSKL